MSLAARSLDRSAPGASGLAEVNGTKLHYELYGSGPPVLLLHGFGLDRRMWRPQVEALSKRHLVICYDARGFGRSANPGPRPYSHFTDAAALLRYLEVGPVLGGDLDGRVGLGGGGGCGSRLLGSAGGERGDGEQAEGEDGRGGGDGRTGDVHGHHRRHWAPKPPATVD